MSKNVSNGTNLAFENKNDLYAMCKESSVFVGKKEIPVQEFLYYMMMHNREKNDYDTFNSQSSQFSIERFELHKASSSSNSDINGRINIKVSTVEKERILSKIRNSYFESGILNEADVYFEALKKKYYGCDAPLELLADIVNHNLADEHILEGILHILSSYSYEEINPIGITIAIACAVNHSPVIQDLLISCFENWDSVDAIPILTGLELDKQWLIEYREEVLCQLKSKERSA